MLISDGKRQLQLLKGLVEAEHAKSQGTHIQAYGGSLVVDGGMDVHHVVLDKIMNKTEVV